MIPKLAFIVAAALWATIDVRPTIKEWATPSPSHPHDPEAGPDGSLWYTGQRANLIGRVDPAGKIQEWPLKRPNSGPHGLVLDPAGNVWFTGNTAAYIGKLDPRTGEVTEYPMPDPRARDPHTPLFDNNGILWFTVQQGNFIGRLDPKTGVVTLKESPTANSRPYGLVMDSKGTLWYCEFNSNKIASINPTTFEIREYAMPNATARPRRLAVAADDRIYWADHQRGYLGRLDPATGQMTEWPSPGGPASRPYGIAGTADGLMWYSESNVQPNTLVAFDPKDNTFKSTPMPNCGGVVRHMVARGNKLFLACSGVHKVAIVEY
jgi:virginiamycin B lyase